jgi:hypothetical protein
MQQERQKEAELKKVNLLRYGSEHFYNSTNTEDLLYVKDGEISKMRQFEKKIFKPIPNQSKATGETIGKSIRKELDDGQTITIKP